MSYIGNPIVSTDFPVDYKSGNGSTTAFTLSVAPASVNSIDVQISGVSQSPQTYSVSGTTLTFSAAPPTGTNNIVVRHLGIAGIPNVPAVGSVTPALLSTANAVYWDGSGNVGIGTSSPYAKTDIVQATAGYGGWKYALGLNATDYPAIRLLATTGNLGNIIGHDGGSLVFLNGTTATSAGTERMRIDASGNLLVGGTGANTGVAIQPNAFGTGNANININHPTGSNNNSYIQFVYSTASVVGSITQNGTTAVAYNTSSDYRLKENIAPMTGALDVVQQLKPVTYNWKADGSSGQGFIAHELQAVVPDCVTGEKDAVDAEGKPVYQGIDTSFLVATLTAAIQELKAELDATKAEVQALKAGA